MEYFPKAIVNYLFEICDKCDIPNHVLYRTINTYHEVIPILFDAISILGPPIYSLVWFVLCIFIYIIFIYFDGCIISALEYKLLDDKKQYVNLFTFLLHIMGYNVNKTNLKITTIIVMYTNIIMLYLIVLYKYNFIKNK